MNGTSLSLEAGGSDTKTRKYARVGLKAEFEKINKSDCHWYVRDLLLDFLTNYSRLAFTSCSASVCNYYMDQMVL
jgi:hypothetical protein